jgi:hypothetical protein
MLFMKKTIPPHQRKQSNEIVPRSRSDRVSPSGISVLSGDLRKPILPHSVDLLFTLKYRR